MHGYLGEKVGEGAMADVHAWAPGQVLKLFKTGVPRQFGEHEARMTRAVFAAGVPAPQVLDEVTVEGRFGMVLTRLDGPTLRECLHSGAVTLEQAGAILARLYKAVHQTVAPREVPSLRGWFTSVSRVPDGIPEHIATGGLRLIERLPPAAGLCHADLHAGNVIMTADGPRIIDWIAAVRAPAALDMARCHVIFSDLVHAPESIDPERPRAFNAAIQSEYARLAGLSAATLAAAVETYLPILRAFALAERATNPGRRELLIQRIEAALQAQSLV
jgi:Ser/Thr protein kinase RdoA (MazF antagonist)